MPCKEARNLSKTLPNPATAIELDEHARASSPGYSIFSENLPNSANSGHFDGGDSPASREGFSKIIDSKEVTRNPLNCVTPWRVRQTFSEIDNMYWRICDPR